MMPQEASTLMKRLSDHGFKAYLVGGCVRDLLLGRPPADWDVATDALPSQVMNIFPEAVPTGLKYGTVTVPGATCIEVTTFRQEGPYLDRRRPENVHFAGSLQDDVARRDFTVNGLAMDASGKVHDFVNGLKDLDSKTIRAIGDPGERFSEDALRLMRAARLACQLDFAIEPQTLSAIKAHAVFIKDVAAERVRDELVKILLSNRPSQGMRLLHETGLLAYIMPELDRCAGFDQDSKYHDKDVFEHALATVDHVPAMTTVRLSALMHDIAKPLTHIEGSQKGESHFYGHDKKSAEIARDVLIRLRFDGKTVETVTVLVREHMSRFAKPGKGLTGVKRLMNRVGTDNLSGLFALQEADIRASRPPYDFSLLQRLKDAVDTVLREKQPLAVKDLAVGGSDLIEWGMKSGPELGLMLDKMMDLVLKDPSMNSKEALQAFFWEQMEKVPVKKGQGKPLALT